MAAPNIRKVAKAYGKTVGIDLTTGGVDILENAAASGKVFKVGFLMISNIDGTNNADVTVNFVDATGPATRKLANVITVPAKSSLIVIGGGEYLYLEEGDKLTGVASANSDLTAVVSYEDITDVP